MTLTEIRRHLAERGLRPLKQFGQNFLHDQNLCVWLIDQAGLPPTDGGQHPSVVEIGPGLGALTSILLERGYEVTALEKDRGLAQFLRDHLGANERFHLIEGDALETVKALPGPCPVVVGNLPYNISTPLLMLLLERAPAPERMLFTLQRELAQRLAAQPRTKDYGAVSVIVQAEYEIEVLRVMPASVFHPQPEVESAAVRLSRKAAPTLPPGERAGFRAFVKRGFSQRRKKLSNVLNVLDPRRAEELSVVEWEELYVRSKPGFSSPACQLHEWEGEP